MVLIILSQHPRFDISLIAQNFGSEIYWADSQNSGLSSIASVAFNASASTNMGCLMFEVLHP
jgi:hypothetical protein